MASRGGNALLKFGYLLIFTAIVWMAVREGKLITAAFSEGTAKGWRTFAAAILPILLVLVYRLMSERNLLDVFFGNRFLTLAFSLLLGFGFMAFLEVDFLGHPWHELIYAVVLALLIDLLFFSHKLDRRWVALSGYALFVGGFLFILIFGATWI